MSLPKRYVWFAVGAAGAMGLLYLRQKLGNEAPETTGSSTDNAKNKAGKKTPAETSEEGEVSNLPPGAKELAAFLAGESWFDEMGWNTVWERAGVGTPEEWLRNKGLAALKTERKKLSDHPALLAGCRRRWIVVCRYAGIDVADAAQLWNGTED
ncbi:MAG: hypothetical protein GY822_09085 [Deltaproteobacteria bacterium]|nr:hypothetical protein [Deltaproteobacteria bacterium]